MKMKLETTDGCSCSDTFVNGKSVYDLSPVITRQIIMKYLCSIEKNDVIGILNDIIEKHGKIGVDTICEDCGEDNYKYTLEF